MVITTVLLLFDNSYSEVSDSLSTVVVIVTVEDVDDQTNADEKVSPSSHKFETEPVASEFRVVICSAVFPEVSVIIPDQVPTKSEFIEIELLSLSSLLQATINRAKNK